MTMLTIPVKYAHVFLSPFCLLIGSGQAILIAQSFSNSAFASAAFMSRGSTYSPSTSARYL
jgi:hypothetical protein